MKKKLFKISLLVLGLALFSRWAYLEFFLLDYGNAVIEELNTGADIDFKYMNKINEYQKAQYDVWQTCNTTLSRELKGDIPDNELVSIAKDYEEQAKKMASLSGEVMEMKKQRSEKFASFKYVTIYKP